MTQASLLCGDVFVSLPTLPSGSIQCCVTSPPYWGLRDYGMAGQLGLERTPEEDVAKMVALFGDVRRGLRDDGTLWLNMGDSYAGYWGENYAHKPFGEDRTADSSTPPNKPSPVFSKSKRLPRGSGRYGGGNNGGPGLKTKDLLGMPWPLAFALKADGWWLRSNIIGANPNPMPESVTDRPTKSHEYVFLLSKSERYYYDADAIAEPAEYREDARAFGDAGGARHGDEGRIYRQSVKRGGFNGKTESMPGRNAFRAFTETRNARTVWRCRG